MFRIDGNEFVGVSSIADKMVRNLPKFKKLNNKKSENLTRIRTTGEPIFLTSITRKAFEYLRQAFTKALILQHFDLESHLQMKIDTLGYTIEIVLSQLSFSWIAADGSIFSNSNFGQ